MGREQMEERVSTFMVDGRTLSREDALAEIDAVIVEARERALEEDEMPADIATMLRNPRLTAHVICASLGYATPSTAARIIDDARSGRQNWCEWIASCHECDPRGAIRMAIRGRHHHRGYMSEYVQALALVARALRWRDEPAFGSWF